MASDLTLNGTAIGASDYDFGPASSTRDLDFTLTFEQSILSILPSALLILVGPLRILRLSRRTSRTLPHIGHIIKTIIAAINFTLELTLVALWAATYPARPQTSVPSAVLSFVASGIILILSHLEEKKAIRPSALINVYLAFSILFSVTQVRTSWFLHYNHVAAVQSAAVGVKIFMLFLEAQQKRAHLMDAYKCYPSESTSGIWSLSLVWWLNCLFVAGFRKLLTTQDLFDIDVDLTSQVVGYRLQNAWDASKNPERSHELPLVVAGCFRWTLVAAAFPRLCMVGFNFAQPFLIVSAIDYLEESSPTQDKNHGFGLIGAAFFIYIGIAYQRFISSSNFLDLDNAIEFLEKINNIWAASLEIAIGTWLLQRQIGLPCIVPLAVTFVCAFGQGRIAMSVGKDQQRWNEAIQHRVKNTTSMLGAIKSIKLSGLMEKTSSNIQTERDQELRTSRPFFWGIMWLNGLSSLLKIWSPVISFTVFALQANLRGTSSLTTVQAFASLSIITLVTSPAEQLLAVVPQIAAALGCFERLLHAMSQKSLIANEKATVDGVYSPSSEKSPHLQHVITVERATIFPAPDAKVAAIIDANFALDVGSLTILLGPIGSGKSTLLKAMLGELSCTTGSISVASSGIGYCSQSAWLLNVSVKESICGPTCSENDPEWYETVLHACALDQDILQWPERDETITGSKGLRLSGGQKQRIALARALYARKPIVLLDDIFSALDTNTQDAIITRLFSSSGIFRRLSMTVVLITHNTRCLQLADKIVVLETSGRSIMQGSYEQLSQREEFLGYTTPNTNEVAPMLDAQYSKAERSPEESPQEAKMDTMMDLVKQTGDLTVYKYYMKYLAPVLWIGFVVVMALVAFTENFPVVWLNWWTQAGGQHLSLYLPVYAALALMASNFSVLSIWVVFLNLMPQAAIRLHQILLQSTIHAPPSFFAATDTGVMLNRFSQDMSLIDLPLPIALITVFGALFGCIAQVALISTGSSYMALTIPFTVLAIYSIQNVYLKTSRQIRYLDLENKSPLFSHFIETLDSLATVRALSWEQKFVETLNSRLDHSQRPYYMLLCIQRWLNLVLDLMVTALAVIVVALAVNLRSTTTASLLVLSLNNVLGFNTSISKLVTSWTSLETSLGAVTRVKTFVETTPSEESIENASVPPSAWPSRGAIEISNVSATYGSSV